MVDYFYGARAALSGLRDRKGLPEDVQADIARWLDVFGTYAATSRMTAELVAGKQAPAIGAIEAIRTTRAMRRLDPSRPVSDSDIETILEAANRGPNGGNRQPVRWIVVRDQEQRRKLGEIYREVTMGPRPGPGQAAAPGTPPPTSEPAPDPLTARRLRSEQHLTEHLGEAPVIIVVCAAGPFERTAPSVYPSVQNLMIAARALGLGTTLTARHTMREDAVKAVLGIPEEVRTYAMIPIGYPLGRWGEGPRRPVQESVYQDRWPESAQ